MEGREVTLLEVLDFREKKAMIQTELKSTCQDSVVVSLGMNIPGPVKSTPSVFRVFEEGKKVLEEKIASCDGKITEEAVLKENAGFAAIYQITGADAKLLKGKAVFLEETHSCGRLYDIDVWDTDGKAITREEVGAEKRKCLLCKQDAKICGRNRTHSVKELSDAVWRMIGNWERSN